MLAEERKKYILSKLSIGDSVHVKDLANELQVSVETIRRDIKELHKKKLLKQVHGGAVSYIRVPFRQDPELRVRQGSELTERQQIAQKAITHLKKNETIVINEGVTSDEFAKALPVDYNLNVYTTSISVAYILYQRMHEGTFSGQVTILSGSIDSLKKATNNELSFELLDRFHFDKAFLTGTAINASGAMETNYEAGRAAEMLVQHSDQHFLLAASSKFGYSSTYCFCPISDIHCIITDSNHPIPSNILKILEEENSTIEIC